MDNFSEDYSDYFGNQYGSDGEYFNNFSNYGTPVLRRFYIKDSRDQDGGYFAYSNMTDIDLEDLQIYSPACNGDQEHCIIFALEQDDSCTKETNLNKEIEPTFFVNILTGGVFGSTTDMSTKKMWKYQDSVTISCN